MSIHSVKQAQADFKSLWDKLEAVTAERDRLRRDCEALNEIIRRTGAGQGSIDALAGEIAIRGWQDLLREVPVHADERERCVKAEVIIRAFLAVAGEEIGECPWHLSGEQRSKCNWCNAVLWLKEVAS